METTDSQRDGHRKAHDRRSTLTQLTDSARKSISARQRASQAQDDADMARMLQALAIQQSRVEEETRQLFAEREKKLWAEIEAAIAEVERAEAERLKATREEKRRKEELEAAKARRAEEEAKRIREEAERRAREDAENAQRSAAERERLDREQREREASEAQAAEEAQRRSAEQNRTEMEWKKWVEKQQWMKREVISVIKGDRQIRMALKGGMRLITRGLGQIVNTKETIIRVVRDRDRWPRLANSRLESCTTSSVSSYRSPRPRQARRRWRRRRSLTFTSSPTCRRHS